MNTRIMFPIFLLLFGMGISLHAQVDQASLLGTWSNYDGQVEIKVTYEKDGTMSMSVITPEQTFDINGTYELDGDEITIATESGPWDCEDGAKGVYKISINGDTSTVSPVSDECYDRQPPVRWTL